MNVENYPKKPNTWKKQQLLHRCAVAEQPKTRAHNGKEKNSN